MSGIETLTKKYNSMSKYDKYNDGFLEGYRQAVVDLQAEKEQENSKLNENQQIVLEWLKECSVKYTPFIACLMLVSRDSPAPENVIKACDSLPTKQEELEIFQVIAEWGLRGEVNE